MEPEYLLANVSEVARDLSRIRLLLLTHCHGDHAGGVHALRAHCDFRVASWPWEIEMLERGSDEDLGLVQARFAGTYPADYKLTHSRGDISLGDGDRLKVGNLTRLSRRSIRRAIREVRSVIRSRPVPACFCSAATRYSGAVSSSS